MFEEEYKGGKSSCREDRCKVCDGPLERPIQLVCDECNKREAEQMEWEFYAEFMAGEEFAAYRKLIKNKGVKV